MEPLVSLTIMNPTKDLRPGESMMWEFQLDAVRKDAVKAVEASVMWYTEGKGEEDIGVHYFQRSSPADVEDGDLRLLRRYETVLPQSPLTYNGTLLKVRWCIRVRVFMKDGTRIVHNQPFQLGNYLALRIANPVEVQTA